MTLFNSHKYRKCAKTIAYSSAGSDNIVIPSGRYNKINFLLKNMTATYSSGNGTAVGYGMADAISLLQIVSDKRGIIYSGTSADAFWNSLRMSEYLPLGLTTSSPVLYNQTVTSATAYSIPFALPVAVEPDEVVTVNVTWNTNTNFVSSSNLTSVTGTLVVSAEYVDQNKTQSLAYRAVELGVISGNATKTVNPDVVMPGAKLIGATLLACTANAGTLADAFSTIQLIDNGDYKYDEDAVIAQYEAQADNQAYKAGVYMLTFEAFVNTQATELVIVNGSTATVAKTRALFIYELPPNGRVPSQPVQSPSPSIAGTASKLRDKLRRRS